MNDTENECWAAYHQCSCNACEMERQYQQELADEQAQEPE